MGTKRVYWAAEPLCHGDVPATADPSSAGGSGSTPSFPLVLGAAGWKDQTVWKWSWEMAEDQKDKFEDWTGKFNGRQPGEETRQHPTDTHSGGLFVRERKIYQRNKFH